MSVEQRAIPKQLSPKAEEARRRLKANPKDVFTPEENKRFEELVTLQKEAKDAEARRWKIISNPTPPGPRDTTHPEFTVDQAKELTALRIIEDKFGPKQKKELIEFLNMKLLPMELEQLRRELHPLPEKERDALTADKPPLLPPDYHGPYFQPPRRVLEAKIKAKEAREAAAAAKKT